MFSSNPANPAVGAETRSPYASASLLIQAATGMALSASLALMLTIFLFGRANPLHATRTWLATLVVTFLVLALWQLSSVRRMWLLTSAQAKGAFKPTAILLGGLLLVSATLNAGLFLSDSINHSFTGDLAFRKAFAVMAAITLSLTHEVQGAVIFRACTGRSFVNSLAREIRRHAPVALPTALLALGVGLGTSFISSMGDDYARYWMIAQALAGGWPYPVSPVGIEYQAGGMSPYLVDLPGLPAAMLLSFAVFGHNTFAAMLPVVVAASLFPLLMYFALRELTGNMALSYMASVAFSMFPLVLFYVLRVPEPDGMFLTLLVSLAFLALRSDAHPDSKWTWPLLGLVAGFTALTRPEGIMYATLLFTTMALRHRTRRGYWVAAALYTTPLMLFSLVMILNFGLPWPTSFAGTVHPAHLIGNLVGFAANALPGYASSLGVPQPLLLMGGSAFTLVYAAGAWILWKRRPQLFFLALLPALSILAFLLVSPILTRPHQPYDFFRRASYGLPYMTLVATYAIGVLITYLHRIKVGQAVSVLLLLCSIAVVSYEMKLAYYPEESYEWGTQILLPGNSLLTTDLYARPYQLPSMPFEWDGQAWITAKSFDYMALRDDLHAHYADLDLHSSARRVDYVLAPFGFFLFGLCYAAGVWRKTADPSGGVRLVHRSGPEREPEQTA